MTYSVIQKLQLEGALRLDAEYYQPKYLEITKTLQSTPHKDFNEVVSNIINGDEIREYVEEDGLPYLRVSDIKEFFIDLSSVVYISNESKIKQSIKLKQNDILLSRSGSLGIAAVATPDLADSVISSHLMRIPTKGVNPYFLVAFLNSKFGKAQIMQRNNGAVVPEINHPSLRSLLVPISPDEAQQGIKKIVKNAYEKIQESNEVYFQAEDLLLREVEFDKVDLASKPFYTTPLKETLADQRLDAEHFHTKFKALREHLKRTKKAKSLGELRSFIKRGLQPKYVGGGEVMVVNSQHLGRTLLSIENTPRTDEKFYEQNERCQLRKNDILFYSTGAYIGRTNVYFDDKEAIASNHVTIIRTTQNCNPTYLAVYLNSPLGLMQADQWASGSAQREIYPADIDRFLVYFPSLEFQQKIADLVQKSYQARKKSKELLEKAKRKVEEMVGRE